MAGLWTLTIRTKAGAASQQTGTMIVVSEHPESHLFVNLSQNVVTAPGQSVNVTVLPDYVSGLRDAASRPGSSETNLMPHFIRCATAYATLGEQCQVLREVFGEYREPVAV